MFESPRSREILATLLRYVDKAEPWDANRLMNDLPTPQLQQTLSNLLFTRHEISKGWSTHGSSPQEPDPWQVARDSMIILKQRSLDVLMDEVYREMKEAATAGLDLTPYQQHIHSLQQEKSRLRADFAAPPR
jgi:hypothetical protein